MRLKSNIILALFFLSTALSFSQQATWIWYPGDYEIWLHREVSLRRNNRSAMDPPFFRLDSHYGLVNFTKTVSLKAAESIQIKSTGRYTVILDGIYLPDTTTYIKMDAGKHKIQIDVANYETIPSIFLSGKTIVSDSSWMVNNGTHQWFRAGYANFNHIHQSPVNFPFKYSLQTPLVIEKINNGLLADFGKETFGRIQLKSISGSGTVVVYYGESKKEAMSDAFCETFDFAKIPPDSSQFTMSVSRAMRYVRIVPTPGVHVKNVALLYEYLPINYIGSFKSSNEDLNKIWDVSAYTMHLTTREFFIDGIKRDRWVWSGDAAQSMLMNYYLFFDKDVVKRTLIALRGKDPVETHINHIVDYSYYWLMSVYNYYHYTGDKEFVEMIYPRMLSLMNFCTSRLNSNGFAEGIGKDWVFLDWAQFDHTGEMSAYQLLLARSMEAMAECAVIVKDSANADKYKQKANELKAKTIQVFWDQKKNIYLHNRVNNELKSDITRYPNIFALLFGYLNNEQAESVKRNVLLNDSVLKITTPYMRFYELAALCESGEQKNVTTEMLNYWGGMIKLGATSFWEVYDPNESGDQHYAMYGRPFGRSLCHSWGASPIYLIGRYYLGVYPSTPGFETFVVEPNMGGLQWIQGTVPVNNGKVDLYMNKKEIKISTTKAGGVLRFRSAKAPETESGKIISKGGNLYEFPLKKMKMEYVISYSAIEK